MNITAILLHYYQERTMQVRRIVQDLRLGSIGPDNIIVFNNNPEVRLVPFGKEIVINSSHNFRWLIRYALGLVTESDCCLFLDDDVTVTGGTLEYLLDYHQVRPEAILGFFGKNLGEDADHPYTTGEEVRNVKGPRRADIVFGRIQFCKTGKLVNAFRLKDMVPDLATNGVISDDILLSLSNLILDGQDNVIVPPEILELSEMGVGSHYTKDHYYIRDETCRKIIGATRPCT